MKTTLKKESIERRFKHGSNGTGEENSEQIKVARSGVGSFV